MGVDLESDGVRNQDSRTAAAAVSDKPTCALCGRVFKRRVGLGVHLRWAARNGGCGKGGHSADPVNRQTVCDRCGHDFASARELSYHHARRRAGKPVCIDSRALRARAIQHLQRQGN